MLRDHIDKYYFDGNYNCAESVLLAANDYYDLGLDEKAIKVVSGYGAGMQTGNVCGTLLSGISILSLKYVETKAHESEDIKPAVTLLMERFKAEIGESILCDDIKPCYFVEGQRCRETVVKACDVIEKVLAEYQPA